MRLVAMTALVLALPVLTLMACTPQSQTVEQPISFSLTEPMANNAVALAQGPDGDTIYSFNGLGAGKGWRDTSHAAFACPISKRRCEAIAPVPGDEGRLASMAVTIDDQIYVFGGYSVAENGSEKSLPYVHRFDPVSGVYDRLADMPVPVDDSVALTYQNRYIYLISGWHDDGNVSLVQVYDSETDSWSRATDYPGEAVFGHAGGVVGNVMVIADGVKVLPQRPANGSRYAPSDQVWRGDIDPDDPHIIVWRNIGPHPGKPLYRMAAAGHSGLGQIIFAGGSDNPYNYNGLGYDGVPSVPSARIFGYDISGDRWTSFADLPEPTMDHRALVFSKGKAYIAGGMAGDQRVRAELTEFRLQQEDTANE